MLDVALAHQQHVVDGALDDRAREHAGLAHRDALGQARLGRGQLQALEGRVHAREVLGLHAHDLDLGLDLARRQGHARDHAAAAHRHHQHLELRRGGQHLERDRALARDHPRVVVGVDHGEAALGRQGQRRGARVLEAVAGEHDLRPEAARALHLHGGREGRHHDHRRNAQALRVVGHALGVVAGRHGDHAACTLHRIERQQAVERAALLEARGELQVLELEPDLGTGDGRKRARMQAGRVLDLAREPGRRRAHVRGAYAAGRAVCLAGRCVKLAHCIPLGFPGRGFYRRALNRIGA